ncbi:hypothetical protein JHK87_004377 [Glycine soja]|nr:hypothetical protein JHK87_004377 [Glycine soja]
MREEKELLNKKLKLVDAKLKKVEDQVNRFSLALKDAKDDVVESFTKDFDAVKDQVKFFHKDIDLTGLGYFKMIHGNQIIDHMGGEALVLGERSQLRGDIGEKNSYSKHYPYVKADVLEKHSRFITQEVVNQVKSSFVLTRSGDDQSIVCISAETGKPAKIKAKRKKLGDREKELLAEIEKMKTGKNVVITNVMAKMKEEKELVDQNVDAIKIKLEMANKKVNELTPVLEDAKDDVVESFTKGFDAAIDQATFPQGNRLI